MLLRDDTNAVGFLDGICLNQFLSGRVDAYSTFERLTFFVVIHARAPALHFVTRKLNAWLAPSDTHAKKVHSSLTSH